MPDNPEKPSGGLLDAFDRLPPLQQLLVALLILPIVVLIVIGVIWVGLIFVGCAMNSGNCP